MLLQSTKKCRKMCGLRLPRLRLMSLSGFRQQFLWNKSKNPFARHFSLLNAAKPSLIIAFWEEFCLAFVFCFRTIAIYSNAIMIR